MKKIFISLGVLLLLPLVVIVIFFSTGGVFGDCSEEIISSVKSPVGGVNVITMEKDCGATTAIATHVLLSRNDKSDKKPLFVVENEKPIRVFWVDSETLKIVFNERDKKAIFKQDNNLFGINVVYEIEQSSDPN